MSAPPVTVDASARDEIRDRHDATLFVEAGAGTGKTTALVDRVVSLIAHGRVAIREVAAITFTEAAAGELRDRIRYRLELGAAGAATPPLAADERARCRAALDDLDDAALSTLHGFAQRILAEHPLEAGLPPRFEVIDDVEASVRFDERWGRFVDALVADPALEPVLLTALALGVDLDHLRRVARVLHDHYERLDVPSAPPIDAPSVDLEPMLAPLERAIAKLAECGIRQDLLFQHVEGLAGWVDVLRDADDDLDRLDLLGQMPKLTAKNKGRMGNWRCPVDEVRALLEQTDAARAAIVGAQQQATLDVLVARLRGFVCGYADDRRRDGRIEFHDLLVLARDVLQGNPGVRAALSERFRVLLIDEFQDTDPLQIEIAVLLASDDPNAGDRPWWDVPLAPGRAFFVGDPKQSIYRFRRADLELYHRVERELRDGRRELTQNFRSVPGVLEWVNHVFTCLFDTAEPGAQAAHVPLVAQREPLPTAATAPVATFGGPAEVPLVAEVRAVEADAVAALVRRIKDDAWQVTDPVTGAVRAARYDDIALLLPTRTALPDLEDALEHGDVPVRIESQSLVFSTAEVRDLLSILTALDDPTDEIALVASLRSPAFGCGDDDLVDYYQRGGRWDYRRAAPDDLPADHPVVTAFAALRRLHDARWWRSVSETVEAVVRERKLLELAVTHRRPRDHWRRIRFFLDQARAYDAASGRGLRGFIDWVAQLADERARAVEIVVPEPDDDALRVLTVHGAKGLEFPIVILAGLNVSPPYRTTPVLWNPDGSFEVRVGRAAQGTRFETAGWDERSRREDALDAAERLRLLYVASTRARDHLLVSLHHKAGTDCHAALLHEHAAGAPAATLDLDAGPSEPPPEPAPPGGGQLPEAPGAREAWIASRAELLARAGRPATVAATTLAEDAAAFGVKHPPAAGVDDAKTRDPALATDEPVDDRPAWRRGRAGTSVGRAVHAVLQSVDLATGAGLDATARAQALAEGIPHREAEVRALARSVLHAPAVRSAVAGGRYWREVPVAAVVGDVTIEGFVDLLVETLEGLVVVDYKTDQVPTDADLDAAMARYRVQGAAYALALERALGTPVARCVFVFARRRHAVEREVDDLGDAVAEVEHRVHQLA